jgi:hypothetical protein
MKSIEGITGAGYRKIAFEIPIRKEIMQLTGISLAIR